MGHWDIRCIGNQHTWTGIYDSFHHPSIKNSMCKTLVNRVKTICEVSNIGCELEHLRACVSKNRPLTSGVKNEFPSYFAHE